MTPLPWYSSSLGGGPKVCCHVLLTILVGFAYSALDPIDARCAYFQNSGRWTDFLRGGFDFYQNEPSGRFHQISRKQCPESFCGVSSVYRRVFAELDKADALCAPGLGVSNSLNSIGVEAPTTQGKSFVVNPSYHKGQIRLRKLPFESNRVVSADFVQGNIQSHRNGRLQGKCGLRDCHCLRQFILGELPKVVAGTRIPIESRSRKIEFPERSYFAGLAGKLSIHVVNFAVRSQYDLGRRPKGKCGGPMTLTTRTTCREPKYKREEKLGWRSLWFTDDQIIEDISGIDLDVSCDGVIWFHLLGPRCKRHEQKWCSQAPHQKGHVTQQSPAILRLCKHDRLTPLP